MGNGNREMEILKKNRKEMLEIKNKNKQTNKQKTTVRQVKNASNRLISKLDAAEEVVSEMEDLSIES